MKKCGSELSIGGQIDINMLSWYVHVERMEEENVVKIVYMSKVDGSRGRGRPKLKWIDSVKACVERERTKHWRSENVDAGP
jgi:predicted ArsR family transcriptional regulator